MGITLISEKEEFRNRPFDGIWRTREAKEIAVKDLGDDHLVNAYAMMATWPIHGRYLEEMQVALEMELRQRGLYGRAQRLIDDRRFEANMWEDWEDQD